MRLYSFGVACVYLVKSSLIAEVVVVRILYSVRGFLIWAPIVSHRNNKQNFGPPN